jgi:MFS family permease
VKVTIVGLPRNIFFLGMVSLFNDFSSEMVFSVLPAFFTAVLRTGAESLGLVNGISEAASNFFKIYSGSLSDRLQRRMPLIFGGYGLSVATRPIYPLMPSVIGVLALRFLDRVGKGLRDSPRDAILSLSAREGQLGRSFGYHRAMDTTGAILGPLAAYFLLRRFALDFVIIFLAAFGIGLFSLASLFFVRDVRATAPQPRLTPRRAFANLTPRYRMLLFAVFVLSSGGIPIAVLLLKSNTLQLQLADIPLFYTIYNFSYATFSLPAGRASDRFERRSVIVAGYLVLLLGYAALAFAASALTVALAFFLLGLFPALTDGVLRALASEITPAAARGSALGAMNAATGFGALIAGVGGGYLWQQVGLRAAFIAGSALVIVGLVLFWGAARRG